MSCGLHEPASGSTLLRMANAVCRACGTPIPFDPPIPRDAECSGCGRDVRCCRNCRHFDTHYNNSCRETMADPVEDKGRRNFCEYFQLDTSPLAAKASPAREADARTQLEQLFGGKGAGRSAAAPEPPPPPTDRAADARKKLDQLFGTKPKSE